MGKQLVLIGGGHAHMMILAHLGNFVQDGHSVTVIQPSVHHYYSGMGAGMLGGTYDKNEIRFKTRHVVEQAGGRFILGRAIRIDPEAQQVFLEDGTTVAYDLLSCNAGSYVQGNVTSPADETIIPVKPIEGLEKARARILTQLQTKAMTVAVVGGGPSGIEVAGNLRQLADAPGLKPLQIQLFGGSRLMSHLTPKIGQLAEKMLKSRNIDIITGNYVEKIDSGRITLADQSSHSVDLIITALGVQPSPIFSVSGLPTGPDGGLEVNSFLQSTGYANIFGGGDCIHFQPQPLDKVGVYAVRQNPVLLHNLKASLTGEPLQPFDPGGSYLLIYNLGRGEGILAKWSIVFPGHWPSRSRIISIASS